MVDEFRFRIRDAEPSDVGQVAAFLSPFVASGLLLSRTEEELQGLMKHAFVAVRMVTDQAVAATANDATAKDAIDEDAIDEDATANDATAKDVIDEVVGFAALEIYSRKLAEIQCLAVTFAHQGTGIGRQLVACCVERAKREHVLELMAISSSDDFLKRCGFDYSLPMQRRALFYRPDET